MDVKMIAISPQTKKWQRAFKGVTALCCEASLQELPGELMKG